MLTPKQKALLDFIQQFEQEQGYAPSQQEIAKHFGFNSLGTVQNYLVRLQRQGLLKKTWNARRSVSLTATAKRKNVPPQPIRMSAASLPLLGRVAAGKPIEAIENAESLEVPPTMLSKGEQFVLKVVGDSMVDDGILNGDFIVVQKQAQATNGQTVVALINNEATVKRYYRLGQRVELHPANPNYEPLVIESLVDSPDFRIEGIVTGVIRHLQY